MSKISTKKKVRSNKVYHIGVIDYLQTWDKSKSGERILKSIQNRKNWNGGSAVPPGLYGQRFRNFTEKQVLAKSSLQGGVDKQINFQNFKIKFIRDMKKELFKDLQLPIKQSN